MKRIISFLPLLFCFIAFAEDKEFANFKNQLLEGINKEKSEFKNYKYQIEKEFLLYKKIVNEEFLKYKNEILKHWNNIEITDRKKFVEYSEDFKIKKVVNFETGEIKVEIISNKKPDIKTFGKELFSLAKETKEEAFNKDTLSQNIEKRLKQKIKHLKTAKVNSALVVGDFITGDKNPTNQKIKESVIYLLKSGKIEKKKAKDGKFIFSFKAKLPPKRILVKAKYYKPLVEINAHKYNLKPELILAIIHTESSFNPMARSYVPAYGLMQIVPQTAGKDTTRYLYGKPVLLSPSFLYNDKNNILIGSTYFYLLYYHYWKEIKDPVSRLYCAIASYNTGAGNVARAFTGTTSIKKAVKIINRMTPSEVYFTLKRKLPYKETRFYLEKVVKRMRIYRHI
ncbi:MAG: transglycosylase [Hydrogenothermus sp.]|nr:MAG: transglycosylase [Hydrogenothermus sp.]